MGLWHRDPSSALAIAVLVGHAALLVVHAQT